jgi:hypothetical protein
MGQPVQVGRITFENPHQARIALEMIDSTLAAVVMADTPVNRVKPIEVDLRLTLTREFDAKTRQAVNDGVAWLRKRKGPLTKVDVTGFMKQFEKRIAQYPPSVQKKVLKSVGAMYDLQRNAYAKSVGIKANFKLIDTKAKAWLKKDNMHWVGTFYDDNLSELLQKSVNNTMLTQGLGRVEAAKVLQDDLAKAIRKGKLPAIAGIPPPGWTGTPAAYWEGLSANLASRASTWSALESFVQGGVEVYTIAAILDERTSEICRTMNGKQFNVSWGTDQRDAIMAAKNPDAVKKVAGWQRAPDVQSKFGVSPGTAATAQQSKDMADAGLALPPYHYRCRTVVISSGSSALVV